MKRKDKMDSECGYMKLTDSTFRKEVLLSDTLVLVEFTTEWCGASHMNAPVFKEIGKLFPREINICRIDMEEYRDIFITYGIHHIPTILLFHQGEIVDHFVGALPRELITGKITALLHKQCR